MAKVTDLYPLLKSYSKKNRSPYIEINAFLDYLEKYIKHKAQEDPDWKKWQANRVVQFWTELSVLVEKNKCTLIENDTGGQVYMPDYFTDMLQEIHRDPDKMADMPFPNEESLGAAIPDNQKKVFYLKSDMDKFIVQSEEPENANDAGDGIEIIKLIFPEGCGSALLLYSMMPRKFLETTMLKIRHYLSTHGNKEFVMKKLIPQFQGNEKYLKEILDQVAIRPIECLNSMEKSGDFTYLFWNYFCNLIKSDISKREQTLSEDMAAIQSAHILEVCNGIYRARAIKTRAKEIAFRNLELCMAKPPFYFSKEEITRFRTDKGTALLGLYSQQELDDYIKKMTTESDNDSLPEWFVINGHKDIQWFLKKEKYLSICVKMLINTRPQIKKTITKRWSKILRVFDSEPAMEKDPEFEKLLGTYTAAYNPPLSAMLEDQKLLWAFEEMEHTNTPIPASSRIFKTGKLLPLSALYSIRRKDMLADAKILLPIWYSIPIISAIASFFHRLARKKRKNQTAESLEIEETLEGKVKIIKELHSLAEAIEAELVPSEHTLETYMAELENKWNRIIHVNSRQNLINDIQALIRDHLRKMIKIYKTKKISRESISEVAVLIVNGTTALHSLSNQESLRLYIELYMVKLLSNVK